MRAQRMVHRDFDLDFTESPLLPEWGLVKSGSKRTETIR